MSRPHLLLVDDSEAILAYETAVLSAHYAISTAKNGHDALRMADELRPHAVLLDLSMPELDGDEVLRRMKADPALCDIPVIIVSSETARADACLRAGAAAYLPKPIRPDTLRATIARVLDDALQKQRQAGVALLFVGVGPLELGLRLEHVHLVTLQPETMPLPTGPEHVRALVDLHGEPICVLDLAAGLHVAHAAPLEDRKLVFLDYSKQRIALCVDDVREPEIVPQAAFIHRSQLGGAEHEPLRRTLEGVATTTRGKMAVVDPLAIFAPGLLAELATIIEGARRSGATGLES